MQNRLSAIRTVALTGLVLATLLSPGIALGSEGASPATTYLYVAGEGQNYSIGSVAQFQIASDGSLAALSPATVTADTDGNPGSVIVDPSGSALLTVNVGTTEITRFPIGNGGVLGNPVSQVINSNGFTSITFARNGKFAIVTNAATVSCYGISGTGVWTLKSVAATGRSGLSVVIDPSGRFVYVANENLSTISGYAISEAGILTPLMPKHIFPSGSLPFTLVVSPNGFLYSADSGAGIIAEFSINQSSGALTRTGGFSTGSGSASGPRWIAFDPAGTYAYVANTSDSTVSQFKVNPNTGALAKTGVDVPTGLAPLQVVVDPSGMFAFTANGDGTVAEFTISGAGTLVPNGSLSLGPDTSYAIALVRR